MPHVTCAFSTFGVQNVIPNGCWSVTAITSKKPSAWEDHRKANTIWNSQRGTVAVNELMRWLICLAFMWQLCHLWGFRLRVTPLSLSPSCVTITKPQAFIPSCHAQQTRRKREYSWSNRDSVLWKAKAICGTTSLRVTVPALFYKEIEKKRQQQIGQTK